MLYHYLKKEGKLVIELYRNIQEKLDTLDFNMLSPGFHMFDFALYNKESVVLNNEIFPYSEKFIGNTTINYNGNQIAIWDMKYQVDNINIFTSKIVHEMFHAYQIENRETRFPNEFDGIYYQYTYENMIWKIQETKLLIEAYNKESIELFYQFISSRNERKKSFPKEVEYENKVETVEGLARLMELKTLNQLDRKLEKMQIEETISYVANEENFFPIRKVLYYIGSLIVLAANKLGIEYQEDDTKTVVDWFEANEFDKTVLNTNQVITNVIDKYHKANELLVKAFFNQDLEVIEDIRITGLDPMNTIKHNEYLFFNHFVRVKSDKSEKNYFGSSCIKLNNETNKHKLYLKKNKTKAK